MKVVKDHYKMLKAATLYYQEGLTQAEIGKKLEISRPVVSKLLQGARESGIVDIYIKDESAYAVQLSVALEKKYEVSEAVVISVNHAMTEEQIKKSVSHEATNYLLQQLPNSKSIGVSWGTTLADVIDELPYVSYPSVKVVPLVGGVSREHLYYDTNHLVFRLSEKIGGSCQYFYAPALAESQELADVLNQTQMLQQALQEAKKVDLAIIGVGNPNQHSTWKRLGYLEKEDLAEIKRTQIIGDAVASLFDKHGQTVNNTISSRMMGIHVEDLKEISKVIIIGTGLEKASSIHGLLQNAAGKTIIVDQYLAEALLKYTH